MKISKYILLVLSVATLAIGCAMVKEREPIKISINIWPGYAYAFIAKERGFFQKNNVDVELILKATTPESVKLFKDGEVDGFFDVFTNVVIVNAEGIPTKVVYITDFSISTDVIIGKPEFQSPSDLKGATISFEGINTFSHLFVLKALEKAGIKETEVQFKNIPALNVLNVLENGIIDAGHTWEPVTTKALKKGYRIIARAGDIPGVITDVLAFHSEIIEKRPDDIQNIVKSLLEAMAFIYSNWNEAIEIMSKATGMTTEEMESGIKGVHLLDLEENIASMEESEKETSLYRSFDTITDFYITSGQLSVKPDIGAIIESGFLLEIKRQQIPQSPETHEK